MLEPDTVGVAVDKEKRSFGGPEFVGTKVIRVRRHRDNVLDKIRKFVRRRAQSFIAGLHRGALEHLPCEILQRVGPFLDPSVTPKRC